MRFGKLGAEELQKYVFCHINKTREEILLSAGPGEDCAALKTDGIIAVSADPITAPMSLEALGALAVDVVCNDIAANGGEPLAILMTVIMPVNAEPEDVGVIMESASRSAAKINADIVGGHTEFSDCVIRPVVSAAAVGKVKRLIKKSDLKSGDTVYMTKYAGIEATVILSESGSEAVKLFKNSLSVTKEAKILSGFENISTMHDVTEGGVIGAVAEICQTAGLGAEIFEEKIPVHPLTAFICKERGIDPCRVISSGSMLFTGKNLENAVKALQAAGIECAGIGTVLENKKIILVKSCGSKTEVKAEPDQLFTFKEDNR